jgi:hypothetical protein
MSKRLGTLVIFGQRWKVVENPKIPEHICGLCHYDKKLIEIRSGLNKDVAKITLLHELLHSVFFRLGFAVTGMPREMEEIIVDQISTALYENLPEINKIYK